MRTSKPIVETFDELGITRVSRWIWNCYVIHDGPVVVDAGLPGVAADLAPVLSDLGGLVRTVIATHGHSDHLGGAPRVAEQFGADIHLPADSLPYLDGAKARNPGALDQARVAPVFRDQPRDLSALAGLVRGTRVAGFGLTPTMRWTGPRPTGGLDDGDDVPGTTGWRVVAAPGHTDDSIALWHAGSGTLLSGDAVLTRRGRAWFTPEVVDAEAAAGTNRRLRELPVSTLLPGHGAPVRGEHVWTDPATADSGSR